MENLQQIRLGKSKKIRGASLIEALSYACARDVKVGGKVVLKKGAVVDARLIASLASAGIDRVPVYDKPRVSIVVIGNGFVLPGMSSGLGKMHDSSIPMLQAALDPLRVRPVFVRRLSSEPKLLRRLVPFALNQSDVMILMLKEALEESFIRELLRGLNAQVVSLTKSVEWKAPQFKENAGQKVVFCLPYDTNLVFQCFYRYIQPAIRFFMGYSNAEPSF